MAAFSRMTALSGDREFSLYHHVFVVDLAVSHFGFGVGIGSDCVSSWSVRALHVLYVISLFVTLVISNCVFEESILVLHFHLA